MTEIRLSGALLCYYQQPDISFFSFSATAQAVDKGISGNRFYHTSPSRWHAHHRRDGINRLDKKRICVGEGHNPRDLLLLEGKGELTSLPHFQQVGLQLVTMAGIFCPLWQLGTERKALRSSIISKPHLPFRSSKKALTICLYSTRYMAKSSPKI